MHPWILSIAAVALLVGPVPVAQDVPIAELPDAPAARQLADWLIVFGRGDQDEYVRFIRERYGNAILGYDTAANLADRQARRYIDTLGLQVGTVEESKPTEIAVLAQAKLTGLWYRLTLKVEPDAPHRISEYTQQRIRPPGKLQLMNESDLVANIKAFMARLSADDAFSGTLLVAKDGEVIFDFVCGQASKAYGATNRLDTRFNIASVGKTFTAISIMQLVEAGKLSLTDTVGEFLPDYPNPDVRDKVTIDHLLTHSSGLGDYHGPKYILKQNTLRRPADYLPLIEETMLAFEPGARMQYSNSGYLLLGLVIERVSGVGYFDYVRTHIFEPAKMMSTGYFEADMDTPNLATGYTNFEDKGEDYHEFHLGVRRNTRLGVKGNPQGGAFATAEDLLRFSKAFREGTLVGSQTVEIMTTPKYFFRKYSTDDIWYGYGFELENINGQRVIGHGGGDLGVSSGVRWYPDSGNYTVVVLSNYDRGGIITMDKLQEMIILGESE